MEAIGKDGRLEYFFLFFFENPFGVNGKEEERKNYEWECSLNSHGNILSLFQRKSLNVLHFSHWTSLVWQNNNPDRCVYILYRWHKIPFNKLAECLVLNRICRWNAIQFYGIHFKIDSPIYGTFTNENNKVNKQQQQQNVCIFLNETSALFARFWTGT